MIKKVLPFITIYLFFFVSFSIEAQTNDFQCSPAILGSGLLPGASPCGSGGGINYGNPVTASGTTNSASNDTLSGSITSCYPNPTVPLKDVWYQFTASETHVEITLTTGGTPQLTNPYVAIYESSNNECVGLIPRDCFSATGTGSFTMTFGPLAYGVKYYLQIASTISGDDGGFVLSIKSKNDCADCLKNSILQAYPLPVKAAYSPDTTVGFCYSVIGYKENFGNRLHGVVPTFGNGWDISTLKIISTADSADLKGEWKWFNNITINGAVVSGFFYDVGNDNNPANNLGDQGDIASIWTFCFTIKTKNKTACDGGQKDLSILFNTYSDGESGSLISTKTCSKDKDYTFKAHMNCCPKPLVSAITSATCNKTKDGTISAFGGVSLFGWIYELYNNKGVKIDKQIITNITSYYTINNLPEGNYYLYITSNQTGSCTTTLNLYVPGPASYYFRQTDFVCGTSTCGNTAKLFDNIGNITSSKWSNGSIGFTGTNLCSGWNYDTLTISTGTCKIVDSVFIFNLPFANPNFNYAKTNYCSSELNATIASFPPTTGGTFNISIDSTNGASINPNTGTTSFTGNRGGIIVVKYTTGLPCSAVGTDTIYVMMSPPPVTIFTNQQLCVGNPNPLFRNDSVGSINWYSDSIIIAANLKFTQSINSNYDPLGSSPLPGTYIYYLTRGSATSSCQSVPTKLTITVHSIPKVDAGKNEIVCPGFGINLFGSGANSYSWQPSNLLNDATLANPIASPGTTTLFTVTGTDQFGCSASDTVTIFVSSNGKCDIKIYNGFTPNGDNHNDFWHIDGIGTDANNEVTIFNRWGEKLWHTKHYDNQNNKWEGQWASGKIVPDGTYYYVILYKGETLKGWVELTR